jgi:site-specific DNA recombinase
MHKQELHQEKHPPLVSKTTFDSIQHALGAVARPRKGEDKRFKFVSFATCDSCGFSITAERHFKRSGRRYVYYRCTQKNKKFKCQSHTYVREDSMPKRWQKCTPKARRPKVEDCRLDPGGVA